MSKRIADDLVLHGGGDGSVHRYWNLQHEAAQYRTEFFAHWREMKLDAVICPPFPIAAAPIGCVDHISALVSYTGLYNLLNCPGGVVPVTKVTHSDTEQLKDYKGHYGDNWDRHIKKANLKSTGMPVGVQVVGLPWKDEICLRLMKEIESGLQVQA
uniref:Amidase domain-containing protein n=1 Tax=Ciona savignyi TaxID=51511 RepID=H2Z7Q6_CIOSA